MQLLVRGPPARPGSGPASATASAPLVAIRLSPSDTLATLRVRAEAAAAAAAAPAAVAGEAVAAGEEAGREEGKGGARCGGVQREVGGEVVCGSFAAKDAQDGDVVEDGEDGDAGRRNRSGSTTPFFSLVHNSRRVYHPFSPLSSLPLSSLGFRELDTVALVPPLSGGGGDGGSTCAESRDCYLRMYAQRKPARVDPKDTRTAKWTRCALSADTLTPPCVVDRLGNLLNKLAVLEALAKKSLPPALRHIRGLKDVVDIHLAEVPGFDEKKAEGEFACRFQCPISGQEFNGSFRFVALRPCGHVISARALKAMQPVAAAAVASSSAKSGAAAGNASGSKGSRAAAGCLVCGKETDLEAAIPINGTEEEVMKLRDAMDAERKAKKAAVAAAAASAAAASAGSTGGKSISSSGDGGTGMVVGEGPGEKEEREGSVAASSSKEQTCSDEGKGGKVEVKKKKTKRLEGPQAAADAAKNGLGSRGAKRYKASEHVPDGATKEVYASIFTSSAKGEFKETYSCRSLPLARN